MMIGEPMVPAFITTPAQPAIPRVVNTVKMTENRVSSVHTSERTAMPITTSTSRIMIGNSVKTSASGTSENAMSIITPPVI